MVEKFRFREVNGKRIILSWKYSLDLIDDFTFLFYIARRVVSVRNTRIGTTT